MNRHAFIALLSLFLISALACSSEQPSVPDKTPPNNYQGELSRLEEARTKWLNLGYENYVMRFGGGCSVCGWWGVGSVVLLVENGEIADMYLAEDPQWDSQNFPVGNSSGVQSITDLFDTIEQILRQAPDHIDIRYNTKLGYPQRINVDFSEDVIDDEFAVWIGNLSPDTSTHISPRLLDSE